MALGANTEQVIITDPDLVAEFEQASGLDGRIQRLIKERLYKRQAERNAVAERRSEMTPIQRRRDIAKAELKEQVLAQEDVYHIHSVLALCGLPYKRVPDEQSHYIREYGRNSLIVQSGFLKDPFTGKTVKQGLPYGTKARLLQLHICTLAIRQKNPIVEIEDSMSAFIRSLGFDVSGGKNGTI